MNFAEYAAYHKHQTFGYRTTAQLRALEREHQQEIKKERKKAKKREQTEEKEESYAKKAKKKTKATTVTAAVYIPPEEPVYVPPEERGKTKETKKAEKKEESKETPRKRRPLYGSSHSPQSTEPNSEREIRWIRSNTKPWRHLVRPHRQRPTPSKNPLVEQGLLDVVQYPLTHPREKRLSFLRRSMSQRAREDPQWPNPQYRQEYEEWELEPAPAFEQRRHPRQAQIMNKHSEWAIKNCVEWIFDQNGRRIGKDGPRQRYQGWRLCQRRNKISGRRTVFDIIYLWHPTEWDNIYLANEGFGNPSENGRPFTRYNRDGSEEQSESIEDKDADPTAEQEESDEHEEQESTNKKRSKRRNNRNRKDGDSGRGRGR
eukprot:766944_1